MAGKYGRIPRSDSIRALDKIFGVSKLFEDEYADEDSENGNGSGDGDAPMPRLKFQGNEYILIGEKVGGEWEGAIATQEAYDNFQESFAHLMPDGRILRFSECIGDLEDIEWLDVDMEVKQ